MKHVKSFALFENETELTGEQKAFLDKHTIGRWGLNPTTGLVDIDGDFDCIDSKLKNLLGVKFGRVSGSFYCYLNQLTTLEGAPQECLGFFCSNNQLTSLKGAPQKVREFNCSYNELTTLEGAPQEVGGSFFCSNNKLTSLKGAPQKVGGDFKCHNNQPFLTSLEGAPVEVGGDFKCHNNRLTSLKGAPQKVERGFLCYDNKLTTLEGAPLGVGGDFDCSRNDLTTLEGAPQKVEKNFMCFDNKLTSLEGAPREVTGYFYLDLEKFKWTPGGKVEYMKENPECVSLILPTLPYDSLLDEVSEDPTLLKTIEDFDKVLYNKVLKGLGWDKMGPDLLRQLKDGIL